MRSFHNATIFLTEASEDRGEVCGLRTPDGGVTEGPRRRACVRVGNGRVRRDICVLTLLHAVLEFIEEY